MLADPLVRRESLAAHRHSIDKRFNSPCKKSLLKDPSVIAMSKRARRVSTAISPIDVKDSDYDSVVDLVRKKKGRRYISFVYYIFTTQ